jgi:hypothetical protein
MQVQPSRMLDFSDADQFVERREHALRQAARYPPSPLTKVTLAWSALRKKWSP